MALSSSGTRGCEHVPPKAISGVDSGDVAGERPWPTDASVSLSRPPMRSPGRFASTGAFVVRRGARRWGLRGFELRKQALGCAQVDRRRVRLHSVRYVEGLLDLGR